MIVFPMAGLSRRFTEKGYSQPKYKLTAHGHSIFWHVLNGFSFYFQKEKFLFVIRDIMETKAFIDEECAALGLRDYQTIVLNEPTSGQAETVLLGLDVVKTTHPTSVTIFNIDTIRYNFRYPHWLGTQKIDGYLEVFRGEGFQWSYVRPDPNPTSTRVLETAEKRPLSDLCSTGLYYFSAASLFRTAYHDMMLNSKKNLTAGEVYVAPLYNSLIEQGADIRYHIIERRDVTFCGTPQEYEIFLSA